MNRKKPGVKKMVHAAALAAGFVLSGSASAMAVDAVFSGNGGLNGDGQWQVMPGDVFTATIIATLSPDENDAGGLLSFSTAASLAPTGIAEISSVNVNDSDWSVGNDSGSDSDSAFALGGTLDTLAPTGTATLFSIDFEAVSPGETLLTLADYEPTAAWDGNVLADGAVLDGTIAYDSHGIEVVPVPAAAWLFGSAVFGLAGIARRRKGC